MNVLTKLLLLGWLIVYGCSQPVNVSFNSSSFQVNVLKDENGISEFISVEAVFSGRDVINMIESVRLYHKTIYWPLIFVGDNRFAAGRLVYALPSLPRGDYRLVARLSGGRTLTADFSFNANYNINNLPFTASPNDDVSASNLFVLYYSDDILLSVIPYTSYRSQPLFFNERLYFYYFNEQLGVGLITHLY